MKLSPAFRTVRVHRLAALAVSTLCALAPVLQAGPPARTTPADSTGTIKGRLVWAGGAIPAPKLAAGAANAKDAVCKAKPIMDKDLVVDPETKGVANAFAYLVNPSGDFAEAEKALVAKTPQVIVDQINCEYVPYATVVHKNQKLTFKSSDPVGHNVDFKPFNGPAINPMLPPNGKYDYTIKAAEKRPTKATCSVHPWMKGYVFIIDHPFAVVTKPDGSFEISGVPAGEQHLVLWESRNGYVTTGAAKGMSVTVKAGETTDVGEIKLTK
jgi:hypothetical protein